MKRKIQLLVIIPARYKSKSIKNKNITKIGNHPLVAFSIEAAKNINEKNKIIHLSTDSKKILKICKLYHKFTDYLRPKKISGDNSLDLEFLNHTLNYYKEKKIFFKFCMILRPTNPVRKKKTINYFYNVFRNSKFDSLKSISESQKTPFKMWFKKNNKIKNIFSYNVKELFNFPRQKLPTTYTQTGTIELISINYKTYLKRLSGKKIMGLKVSKDESVDIDEMEDFKKASKIIFSRKYISPKKI